MSRRLGAPHLVEARMSRRKVDPTIISFAFRLTGEDAVRFKEYWTDQEFATHNIAAKVLIMAALAEFPKWGVHKAERLGEIMLFKKQMVEAMLTKVVELEQDIKDELALAETNLHAHQT